VNSKLPSRFLSLAIFSTLLISFILILPIKYVIGGFLNTPLTSLDVNGTNIYNQVDGYNSSHGIENIFFDIDTKVLTLNNASLNNISASGSLEIEIIGVNSVHPSTDTTAILAMGGDLKITGNSSSLNVTAFNSSQIALSIGAGGRLTIGSTGEVITVTVAQGILNNCEDTFVVEGNTLNLPEAGDPPGPLPQDPLQIYVDGSIVIDETADPQITSASGTGWEIVYTDWAGYQIDIDATVSPTFPYIFGNGDGSISINAIDGDVIVLENEDSLSVNFDGNVDVRFGMGEVGNVQLVGGIFTNGQVVGGDSDVFVGTPETPSLYGIGASSVSVNFGDITINTSGTGLYYGADLPPIEGEGMLLQARQNGILKIGSSNIATENVISALVLGGGVMDFTYSTELGTFTPQAGYWEWAEFTGTEQENTEPTIVSCSEGVDTENRYSLTLSASNFLLESTSKALFQLGFNYDDSDDSRVVNGTVNVIAARGYKFVSGGFYDFSIEEGTEVTIELLPDYGYQYVSGGINGNPTSPEEGKASYTFTMPSNHVHISAIFERTDDIVDVGTTSIKSASLVMPQTEINGNAELIIEDASGMTTAPFESAAGDFEVEKYLDISLNEVIVKGGTEDVWRTNLTELESETNISLSLSDNLKGHSEYMVIREHEGTVEEIESVYNPNTGTISFNTDTFSTYAIAYKDISNPNTFDNIFQIVVLGVSSIVLLFATILVTKKNKSIYKQSMI